MTLGLISNPMARTNWRSVAHDRLRTLLDDPSLAISTPSVDAVPGAVRELLLERACNVLAINGGDGTIHTVIEATIAVLDAEDPPLPRPVFLLLNGGGMNMLARTFDTRGHPVKTLRRFLSYASRAPLGARGAGACGTGGDCPQLVVFRVAIAAPVLVLSPPCAKDAVDVGPHPGGDSRGPGR